MIPFLLVVATFFAPSAAAGKALSDEEKAKVLAELDAHYYYPGQHGLKSLEVKLRSRQIDQALLQEVPNRYVLPRGRHVWRAPGARRLWMSGVPPDLTESFRQAEHFFRYRLPFVVPTTYTRSLEKLIIHRAPHDKGEVWKCFEDRFATEPMKTLYMDEQGKVTRMEVRARGRHSDIRYTYYDKEVCPQGLLLKRARYTVKAGKQTSFYEHQFYYLKISGFYLLKRLSTIVLQADGSAVTSATNPFTLELYDHQVNLPEEGLKTEASSQPGKAKTDARKSP